MQRVAYEIVKRLDSYRNFVNKNDIVIVSPIHVENSYNFRFKNIKHIKKGKLSPLWEYIYLTLEVLKRKGICFSFSSGFPLFCNSGVYFLHDVSFKANPSFFSKKYRILYDVLIKNLEKKPNVIILTNSEFSKNEILKYYPKLEKRIYIVPLGWEHVSEIEPNEKILEKLGIKEEYFLTVATLTKHKNLQIIIQAAQKKKDTMFIVVGRKPEYRVFGKDLKKLFSTLENLKNVMFTGYLNDSELISLMKNSKAFILPSLYEGFGLPALESLYFNVPLVLSDIPVLREIYKNVAVFFDPHDPEDLIGKIDMVNRYNLKPIERDRILSKYTWKSCVKNIIKISSEKLFIS